MRLVFEGADTMKKCVKALTKLIDEGEFLIDEEGMQLRAVDPSKIAMVDFKIPRHAFREYEIEGPTRIPLDLGDLQDVLKRAKATEDLIMELSPDKSRLEITLVGRAKRRFSLPLIDLSASQVPSPNLTFDATVKVVAEVLQNALKDADIFSTHVVLEATEEYFKLLASGTKGEYELELKRDESDALLELSVTEKARAAFPLEYLEDILSQAGKSSAVTLYLKTDRPLKVYYSIGDADLTYYLAPKIEESV